MTDFADVEQFGREHGGCGGITPSAAPQPSGGFLLTLTCTCGATFERWVTPEEAGRPLPLPPRTIAPGGRPAAPPRPPGGDLEAALRAAVEAEDATGAAPPARAPAGPPNAPAADMDAVMREALAAESKPSAPPAGPSPGVPRWSPPKLNLDTTIRTALTQQAALSAGAKRPAAAPRTRVVWLLLFAIVGLGAAVALYFAGTAETPPATTAGSAPAPAPPLDVQQRAALSETLKSLRTLQAASSPNTSMSVYSSRVAFAKSDVERFLVSIAPGPARRGVREVLDVHLLAAAAWKARTLEQKDMWEAVGQDPAIDLCPSVKRIVDFAAPPAENLTRAQARGVAVASSVPLLWECAAQKLAVLEQAPAE